MTQAVKSLPNECEARVQTPVLPEGRKKKKKESELPYVENCPLDLFMWAIHLSAALNLCPFLPLKPCPMVRQELGQTSLLRKAFQVSFPSHGLQG
jgi:hypothetical protein